MNITFDQAKQYGFNFPGAREWVTQDNMPRIIQDAALITQANSTVPAEYLAYIDPTVVEIMTAPRNARELFSEEKRGDWTTPYFKWRADEIAGNTAPYSDYGQFGMSNFNSEWHVREQYRFQTIIQYGDLEQDMSSQAKVNLAASKQRSAATTIDIDANKFYLLGVSGKEIYGVLNDPNLPAAVTPISVGGQTAWSAKDAIARYNDVIKVFTQLTTQLNGLVDEKSRLKIAMSPATRTLLAAPTSLGLTTMKMLEDYFPNAEFVSLPQLGAAYAPAAAETIMIIAPQVLGNQSGLLGFGEKIRMGRVIAELSSFKQKVTGTTYGGVIKVPAAVAQMTGI
ncbi:major capsid family protein [Pantoea sp.]|uniref:major capsid family protein n=1 Tax=Pantoea sp. TaxID=69393 RepID=UPI0028A7FB30|nr:major capsid family protein [Pantoea sp.]